MMMEQEDREPVGFIQIKATPESIDRAQKMPGGVLLENVGLYPASPVLFEGTRVNNPPETVSVLVSNETWKALAKDPTAQINVRRAPDGSFMGVQGETEAPPTLH